MELSVIDSDEGLFMRLVLVTTVILLLLVVSCISQNFQIGLGNMFIMHGTV